MKDKAGSTITSKQLIFLIVSTQLSIELLWLPREVSAAAGVDAWLAMLLASLAPLLSLFFIDRLGRRMPGIGFAEVCKKLVGMYLGALLIMIFVAYIIGLGALSVRLYAEVTKYYLLPKTPLAIVLLMYVLPIVYIGNKGSRVIARLNELLFYLFMLCFLILIVPLGAGDYTNLLPVGASGVEGIARGVVSSIPFYYGIEILLVFYSLVNRQDEILKAGFVATAITTALSVGVIIICELVFDQVDMQKQLFPGLVLLKIVQVPVLERLEFIFLFFFLGMGARQATIMSFAAALSFTQLLNLDEKKYLIYPLLLIGLGIFILALLPADLLTAFKLFKYLGYGFLVIGIALPISLLVVAMLRGKKVMQNG